ncbi:MAG: hypothetical protein RL077_4332 [Verrucomicrobiota bacterium]|jgi:lysophospholipase L1-like esterase/nicotinamidase-related amidase
MKTLRVIWLFSGLWFTGVGFAETPLKLKLQTRTATNKPVAVAEQWLPSRTAIIVCDMWDLHHCKNAVVREGEMAPRMNELLETVRRAGILIIHAPSGCLKPYEGTPARKRAQSAPAAARVPADIGTWCQQIPAEESAIYPLDQNDSEDDDPAEHAQWAGDLVAKGLNPRAPWTKQIEVLHIDQERDAISDSGEEIWNLLDARRIDNVILMGVHVNMCVTGRPFGLRQLVKNGKHVVLMRDLTDSMYNPARWPFVSHERGTDLFIQYVEKRICPTVTSDQILGGQPFKFSTATAGKKRTQILLLGDSSTEASFPKKFAPDEPQLEDTLRGLLASEGGLPPCDVWNEGVSGEFVRGLLDTRYDRAVKTKPPADYIFIRYGLNDVRKREDFDQNFAKDLRELITRLRQDHPGAIIIPTTVIPFAEDLTAHAPAAKRINDLVRRVAEEEMLPLFDLYPLYATEQAKGLNMLNYRRYALSKVPENLRALATPYIADPRGKDPTIVVMDNRLDAIFGHLPGWFSDRHPNLAGYTVIATATAKFLQPMLREKAGLATN